MENKALFDCILSTLLWSFVLKYYLKIFSSRASISITKLADQMVFIPLTILCAWSKSFSYGLQFCKKKWIIPPIYWYRIIYWILILFLLAFYFCLPIQSHIKRKWSISIDSYWIIFRCLPYGLRLNLYQPQSFNILLKFKKKMIESYSFETQTNHTESPLLIKHQQHVIKQTTATKKKKRELDCTQLSGHRTSFCNLMPCTHSCIQFYRFYNLKHV